MHRLLAFIFVISPSVAFAGPLDLYGAGERGRAMRAQTATGTDGFAPNYNPALTPTVKKAVSVGGFATFNSAQIRLHDRPNGYAIGEDLGAVSSDATRNPRTDTDGIDPLFAMTGAFTTPLVLEGLHGSFSFFLPTEGLFSLKTHFPDERERLFSNQLSFELIDKDTRRIDLNFAIGYQLADFVSFGVGGNLIPGTTLRSEVYIDDPANQTNVDSNATLAASSSWGIRAGLRFDLPKGFKIGLAYKGSNSFEIEGANTLLIRGIDETGETVQGLNWTPIYSPTSFTGGFAWETENIDFAADLRYIVWSDYRDTQSARPDFSDTLSTHLGVEYHYTKKTDLRLGAEFVPSPVPTQIGRTNYVDNDRWVMALGSAHQFELAETEMAFSWSFQFQYLVNRTTLKSTTTDAQCDEGVKNICDEVPDDRIDPATGQPQSGGRGLQTENPGFPGYTSGGWLGVISGEVSF